MQHFSFFFLFAAAFAGAASLMPIVISFAKSKGLMESSCRRKRHSERVSSLGGIPIFAATLLSIGIFLFPGLNSPVMCLSLCLPLLMVGFLDDLIDIGITVRIVLQILVGLMLFDMGFQILDSGHWWADMGATVFFVMLCINAYNFIDGINGLAGSLGLVGSLFAGFLLTANGDIEMAGACFAYAGGMAGFLLFNFGNKAKIFMGDSGSTVLGFIMAFMVMAVLKSEAAAGVETSSWPMLLAIVSVPVIDLFRVTIWRMVQLRSPFAADRSHIHHLLVDGMLSHPAACLLLTSWTATFAILAFIFPVFFSLENTLAFLAGPYFLALVFSFAKNGLGSFLAKGNVGVKGVAR